jgi:hypothetical protein
MDSVILAALATNGCGFDIDPMGHGVVGLLRNGKNANATLRNLANHQSIDAGRTRLIPLATACLATKMSYERTCKNCKKNGYINFLQFLQYAASAVSRDCLRVHAVQRRFAPACLDRDDAQPVVVHQEL